jgi:protein-tyrosine-phosphatase
MFLSFSQVKLMCSFCKKHEETEVPDPYYGGPQGFEKVMHEHFELNGQSSYWKFVKSW